MPATASPFASVKLPASLVQQAREAIALCDARLHPASAPVDESLEAIEARFVEADARGRLAQAVRDTVLAQRQRAQASARKAA